MPPLTMSSVVSPRVTVRLVKTLDSNIVAWRRTAVRLCGGEGGAAAV